MLKKIMGIWICLSFLPALVGCGGGSAAEPSPSPADPTEQVETAPVPTERELEETEDSAILVAYFSATGTTEQVAQQAAEILGADIYEIVPEEPYTEADLAYYTGGRADQEQDDPSARPAITGGVEDMSQYGTIFLGYPIWHGQAPRIISTFLESYELEGKTIIPFCTSHSSGLGSSAEALHELCPHTVTWAGGTRFAADTPREEIESWLRELGY